MSPLTFPNWTAASGSQDGTGADAYRNFTKFLVDKQGKVVSRYGSSTTPEQLRAEIEKLL